MRRVDGAGFIERHAVGVPRSLHRYPAALYVACDPVGIAGAGRAVTGSAAAYRDDAFSRFDRDLFIGAQWIRHFSFAVAHVLARQATVFPALHADGLVIGALAQPHGREFTVQRAELDLQGR